MEVQREDERCLVDQRKLECRERTRKAAEGTTGETLTQADNQWSDNLLEHSQPERAKQNGVGVVTQRKLDRLARDHPALHQKVITGELSTHAAAKEAGIVKDPTPLTQLTKWWAKASNDEPLLADIDC